MCFVFRHASMGFSKIRVVTKFIFLNNRNMTSRKNSDEHYVLDLCDEILGPVSYTHLTLPTILRV